MNAARRSDHSKPRGYGFWAHMQTWLQGCYPHAPHRPWLMWKLGNFIADCRYWTWRLTGGKHGEF